MCRTLFWDQLVNSYAIYFIQTNIYCFSHIHQSVTRGFSLSNLILDSWKQWKMYEYNLQQIHFLENFNHIYYCRNGSVFRKIFRVCRLINLGNSSCFKVLREYSSHKYSINKRAKRIDYYLTNGFIRELVSVLVVFRDDIIFKHSPWLTGRGRKWKQFEGIFGMV